MSLQNFFRRVVLALLAFVLVHGVAQAVSSPVQIVTTEPGIGTEAPNVLLVALPIRNVGTGAAGDVSISSIKLGAAPLLQPASFPQSLGALAPDASLLVNAQFDRSALSRGTNYRLTISGTYKVGRKTYGFAVDRNITMPTLSPGTARLATVSVPSSVLRNPPRRPVPANLPGGEEEGRNPPGPPVPVGKYQIVFPGAFTTPASDEGSLPGQGGVPPVSFSSNSPFGKGNGSPADPSGASGVGANAANIVLTTGNTYGSVSVDGGQTFTRINPFCMFGYIACDAAGNPTGSPLVDGNLCCDQVVQYVPAINRFVWLMQTWPTGWPGGNGSNAMPPVPSGQNRLRIVVVSPEDVRSWATGGASSWVFYDLTSATLGLTGANDWMDYPDLSVGDNFLYVSVDRRGSGSGLMVARIPLGQLASSSTINIQYTPPGVIAGKAHGSHLVQNSRNSMFWAGHNSNNKLTIFNMPENSNQFSWRDVDINSYPNTAADYASSTASTTNWLTGSRGGLPANTPGFGLENIQGGVRVPFIGLCNPDTGCPASEIWFAWGAGKNPGQGRPQPYVEVVHIDSENFNVKRQMHIWNASFAFAYPAFALNSAGEAGVAIAVGGPDREVHTSVGFMGDFNVWALSNSDRSESRYGDYLTIRRASPNEKLFSAVGYGITSATGYDPHYVLFGRPCDVHPADPGCQIIVH